MNRPIKFRAYYQHPKDCERGQIVAPEEVDKWQVMALREPDAGGGILEVMQFTGLKDKNGKDCYEGDTVRRYCEDGKEHLFTIEYKDDFGAFMFVERKGGVSGWSHMNGGHSLFWWEVIGNIYE